MSKTRLAWILIAALTLAALALRVRGIGHGLPMTLEQDCKIPRQVELLRQGGDAWRSDKEFRWYPLLVAHLVKTWPAPQAAGPSAPLEEHLHAAASPHLQSRLTVAALAVLAIPLTFLLASGFLERRWALASAAFVAFSLLHHSFSQQSRPHAVAGTLFLAAVVAAVRLRRKGDALNYSLAGAAAALSIGCLHTGVLTLPALGVAHFGRRVHKRRWLDPKLLVALLPVALALPVFYPFLFFGAPLEGASQAKSLGFDTSTWTLYLGGHEIFLRQFLGRGLEPTVRALWSFDPTLLSMTLAAGLLALPRLAKARAAAPAPEQFTRRRDAWVVLSFVVPYALVVLLYERTYERFLIPLLPYCALAAGFALRELARLAGSRAAVLASPTGQAALAGAVFALPVWASWRLAEIRAAPHTTAVAAQWLSAHAQPTQDIALWPGLDVPLARDTAAIGPWPGPKVDVAARFQWPWTRYQALRTDWAPEPRWKLRWWPAKLLQMRSDPAAYVREQRGELMLVEVFAENRADPAGTLVRAELQRDYELLERISPDGPNTASEHPLGYQEETSVRAPHFCARVLGARRTGPVIEIYAPRSR